MKRVFGFCTDSGLPSMISAVSGLELRTFLVKRPRADAKGGRAGAHCLKLGKARPLMSERTTGTSTDARLLLRRITWKSSIARLE